VLKFLGSVARVAFGFALASLAAGLVTVLFVNTPADVLAEPVNRLPRTASETFELALLTATHAAVFAATFALIISIAGELFSIRRLPFYVIGGVLIAMLGFIAQYESEVSGEPTILNNYALKAFLTTGFFAGFVYWLAAGQFAGKAPEKPARMSSNGFIPGISPRARDDETSVIIRKPMPIAKPRPPYRTLLSRLNFRKRAATDPKQENRERGANDEQ
jgi:hypothetical protein